MRLYIFLLAAVSSLHLGANAQAAATSCNGKPTQVKYKGEDKEFKCFDEKELKCWTTGQCASDGKVMEPKGTGFQIKWCKWNEELPITLNNDNELVVSCEIPKMDDLEADDVASFTGIANKVPKDKFDLFKGKFDWPIKDAEVGKAVKCSKPYEIGHYYLCYHPICDYRLSIPSGFSSCIPPITTAIAKATVDPEFVKKAGVEPKALCDKNVKPDGTFDQSCIMRPLCNQDGFMYAKDADICDTLCNAEKSQVMRSNPKPECLPLPPCENSMTDDKKGLTSSKEASPTRNIYSRNSKEPLHKLNPFAVALQCRPWCSEGESIKHWNNEVNVVEENPGPCIYLPGCAPNGQQQKGLLNPMDSIRCFSRKVCTLDTPPDEPCVGPRPEEEAKNKVEAEQRAKKGKMFFILGAVSCGLAIVLLIASVIMYMMYRSKFKTVKRDKASGKTIGGDTETTGASQIETNATEATTTAATEVTGA